ncbi:hypothetical protein C5167_004563 [Papaver somniferum]|uniref:Uncharacterized protein n=1 Tax=Papaver somniferum TaxID=3469 RepID=A0A4Y7J7Z0_PAPSO|nr:hypothetical protein C5167_004563 [Papaver somniferum]
MDLIAFCSINCLRKSGISISLIGSTCVRMKTISSYYSAHALGEGDID